MKMSKRYRWMLAVALIALATLALSQVDAVRAIFNGAHALRVFLRVQTEIIQKSPAGQHYESLFWKHNDEILQILNAHPEHREQFENAALLFVPELDALLNGDGDDAYVTLEHVQALKAELDWFSSMGSPALREDIRQEQERLPLDALIGMTMTEALDFVNSNGTPALEVEKYLVPDSGGEWAYLVHNGVYLEYPSSYNPQISEIEKNYIYFVPTTGTPEEWNSCVVKVQIRNLPATELDANNPRGWYADESIVWENIVQSAEFEGIEFIPSIKTFPVMDFRAFLYSQEYQIAVDIWVLVNENPQVPEGFDYDAMLDSRYEYFEHLVDSIRIQMP